MTEPPVETAVGRRPADGRDGDGGPRAPAAVPAGVIGVGRLGAEHARILADLPECRLVGIHDRDRVRGEAVARRLGTRHFGDAAALLEEAEAIVIAVPSAAHHGVARAALLAGRHALVEKPLAVSLEEADDLVALAEERGLRLAVGHVERFNAVIRRCEPLLDGPRYVESERLAPFRDRGTDVSVILDLMIHDIDLVLGLVGGRVTSVSAVGVPVLSDSPDIANARLTFEGGAVANITASRVSLVPKRKLRFFQPTGYISLDLTAGRGEFLRRRGASPPVGDTHAGGGRPAELPPGLRDVLERIPLSGDGVEPLRLELESFLRAVRGEAGRVVSAREGRAALELALAITREIEEFTDVVAQDT